MNPARYLGIDDTVKWRYDNTDLDLGSAWKEKVFNDSAWPEGPATLFVRQP